MGTMSHLAPNFWLAVQVLLWKRIVHVYPSYVSRQDVCQAVWGGVKEYLNKYCNYRSI